MSTLRQGAETATDLACRTLTRRRVVRAARFILRRACLDVPNDMGSNGELWLQREVLTGSPPGHKIHVIDVGANVGRWSVAMLSAAQKLGRLDDLDLHAFEPSSYTFARLSETVSGPSVRLNNAALSDRSGLSSLNVIAPGAGRNSLHEVSGGLEDFVTEEVTTTTLDTYAEDAGLDHIAFVKVDTEGHDLAVLGGAQHLLAARRIKIVQFEYNQRWVYARSFLRDAFELLVPIGYRVGKLTPRGVEFYPGWDADLETFVEGNYVACTAEMSEALPAVTWWKLGREGMSA